VPNIELTVTEDAPIVLSPVDDSPVQMRVAEGFAQLLDAAIYVDGTTLYINTSLINGNEVSY
jgi:hypothetical protein